MKEGTSVKAPSVLYFLWNKSIFLKPPSVLMPALGGEGLKLVVINTLENMRNIRLLNI